MKKCSRCGEIKSINDFGKNKNMTSGRLNQCKKCSYSANQNAWRSKVKRNKELYGIGGRTIRTYGLELALFVYDRADRKCEECNSEYDLTIHHNDGNGRHNEEKRLPMNNHPDNLKVLCRVCHGRIHGREPKKRK